MTPAKLAIPWYVHPALAPHDWAWLGTRHPEVSFAVINVQNGPGPDNDEYYPDAVALLREVRLLGYVRVDYGRRPVEDVADDVSAWLRMYGVDGIMLDELPSDPENLDRCAQYAAAARAAGITFLAANPGVFPPPALLDLFDVTAVFEGSAEEYAGFTHPDWARDVPPSQLWHLVYECDAGQIAAYSLLAANRGAANMFATDRSLPNPWLGLPTPQSARLLRAPRAARR